MITKKVLIAISIILIFIFGLSIPSLIGTISLKNIPIKAVIISNSNILFINESFSFFSDKSVGDIKEYYWDFGDGTDSTDKNPTHSYLSSGYYNVTLTIKDRLNHKAKTNNVIGVQHQNMSIDIDGQRMMHVGGGRVGPLYSIEIGPNIQNPTVNVTVLIIKGIGDFRIDLGCNSEMDMSSAYIIKSQAVTLTHQTYVFLDSTDSNEIPSNNNNSTFLFLVWISINKGEWRDILTSIDANFSLNATQMQ